MPRPKSVKSVVAERAEKIAQATQARVSELASKVSVALVDTARCSPTVSTSVLDVQVGGDHYKELGGYQPWSVMAKWLNAEELKGYMKGTVCAYLCREEDKGGRQDIEKAMHTLQLYLEVSK